MNKFLFTLVFVLSFFSIHAQSQTPQNEMQTLTQRIDSLEHKLSYLELSYKLTTLNSDITMFINSIDTKTIDLQLKLYNKIFDSSINDAYQGFYKACQNREQSFVELIKATKEFFAVMLTIHIYSENEYEVLMRNYNVIDSAVDNLECSMDLLKGTIDLYNKFM